MWVSSFTENQEGSRTRQCHKDCADQLASIFLLIFIRWLELCEVPSCFKRSTIVLHHPPTLRHRNKLLQACCPDICNHKVLWKTGVGTPEGHHRLPAVCLPDKQVCGWYSQHGTGLHPATPRISKVGLSVVVVVICLKTIWSPFISDWIVSKVLKWQIYNRNKSICDWLTSEQAPLCSPPPVRSTDNHTERVSGIMFKHLFYEHRWIKATVNTPGWCRCHCVPQWFHFDCTCMMTYDK